MIRFAPNHIKNLAYKLVCVFLASISVEHAAIAETVSLKMHDELVAQASYQPGEKNRPAILLLHGFLQTHNFSIIQSIANELTDNGYSVLAPTLTMGINNRNQSMTCEMIQSHEFDDHHGELNNWINWLKQKGHNKIILIGHSTGAMRLISYTSKKRNQLNNISSIILISPTIPSIANNPKQIKNDLNRAYSQIKKGHTNPDKYTLSYCQDSYIAPAKPYISYASLSENTIFDYIKKTTAPITIIMGNKDKLIPEDWHNKLKSRGVDITLIEGANHFYSNSHEFELFDAITSIIEQQ